ncbi:UNVERIFIED_CONTAM: ketosteroid isomerase-like protein [Williamsia faeni]
MSLSFQQKVDIVTEYLDRIGALDFEGAGRYLAENAVMVVPFSPSSQEIPPLMGGQAILDQLRGTVASAFESMTFTVDQWYDVADSDVVIAEYHSVCPLKGRSGEYRNSYVGVFRFARDTIILHKEYFNPVRLAALAPGDGSRL